MSVEFTLREYTPEEHKADMLKELDSMGLYKAVEARCDFIDEECVNQEMGYVAHRCIQEWMCEILELIELNTERKN